MVRRITLVAILLLCGLLFGVCCAALVTRISFTARAPDAGCVYVPQDPNSAPFPIDKARIVGQFMKWAQSKASPKWSYDIKACDPEGDLFYVELVTPPPDFTLTPNDAAGTFTISGTLPVGVNYYYFHAWDAPNRELADPCDTVYTLVVRGTRGNKWPILRWLFQ